MMKKYCFGDNLIYLRKMYKLSQTQLGVIVGKTHSAISNWERGTREPSDADVQAFCEHFGLSPADLMYRRLDEQVKATPAEREEELILLARLMDEEQFRKLFDYAVELLGEGNASLS
jgi:transcriptional regulator with XRE-family HTH domain